jgi:Domain of unknown function (DUF4190)
MTQLPPMAYAPNPQQPGAGMAVASMVLGIIALVLFCVWYVSIPCAIVAIVLGVMARGKAQRGEASGRGMATAGLTCGIVALVLDILLLILAIVGFSMFGSEIQKELQRQQQMQQQQTAPPPPPPSPSAPSSPPAPPPPGPEAP